MSDLGHRQVELAAFLTGSGPLPHGFDPEAGAVAARSLDHKRAGEIAEAFPALAAALGPDFRPTVLDWLPGRPRTSPSEQATAFGRHLAERGVLPEHVIVETARRVARGHRWRVATRVRMGRTKVLVLGSPRRIRAVRVRSLN